MILTVDHHDTGNCRIYLRELAHKKNLYCLMNGYHNYGFMGLFYCSRDGEPDYQISNESYTVNGIEKSVIESVPSRGCSLYGDRVLAVMLGITE